MGLTLTFLVIANRQQGFSGVTFTATDLKVYDRNGGRHLNGPSDSASGWFWFQM